MGSACGVSWDGTSSGKLEESSIPDDDFESHYLNTGDTKSDSSFPVVDGEGNLRAGNVNSAWDLRGQGDGVSEECLRKLDRAFDENVLPQNAYDNSMETITLGDDELDGKFGVNVEFSKPPLSILDDGFNEYGVRENEDGSVDVRFEAMEPGVRKNVNITTDFLQNVVSHDYDRIPLQMDHSESQRANAGYIDPEYLDFNGKVVLQAHVPNTGSSIRDDIIADFTHEPPQIKDISLSFDPRTVEIMEPENRGDPPKFADARLREVSLTPFPAGYDNGGLTPAFSSAVEKAVIDPEEFNDDPARSQLLRRPHLLVRK